MKTRSTEKILNELTIHLVRMSGDLEHIKEKVDDNNKHLLRLNGRVRENEKQISWIKGIGTTITFVVSVILTWFGVNK